MEENLQQQNTTENIPPQVPQKSHMTKRQENELKKERFFKRLKLAGKLLILLFFVYIAAGILRGMYMRSRQNYVKEDVPPVDIIIKDDDENGNLNKKEKFYSEKYGFSFEYKSVDKLKVIDEENREFSVSVLSSDIVPAENPTSFNLIKGFMYTVNPLNLSGRDLDDVATIKKEWFIENCPETAIFSGITKTFIAAHEGRRFEIQKCNSDYIVSYIPANNYIYEIIQVFKGDVGFIQKYKLETDLITETFELYEDLPEPDPFINYYNSTTRISFKYPRTLDTECCKVPAVPEKEGDSVKSVITVSNGGNDKAIGFYEVSPNRREDFEVYATKLENLLRDDYKVIKGTAAPGSRKVITVGDNLKAYFYENLSWKGNQIILIENSNHRRIRLVISYINPDEEILNGILDSLTLIYR